MQIIKRKMKVEKTKMAQTACKEGGTP